MDNAREERARLLLQKRFQDALETLRRSDTALLTNRPVAMCSSGFRDVVTSVASLTGSGNGPFDRYVVAFATLTLECQELDSYAREAFFDALLLYGEDPDGLLDDEGGCVKMIANFLGTLHDLSLFITRVYDVAANIIRQLHAFFNLPPATFQKAQDRLMCRVWAAYGELLTTMATLEEIIRTHPCLGEHWKVYAKTMQMVQHNPAQFNAVDERFKSLLGMIANIDATVMSGYIFQNLIDLPLPRELVEDNPFAQRMQRIVSDFATLWEKEDPVIKRDLVAIFALAIISNRLQSLDKKAVKQLVATHKKLFCFQLVGDVQFIPIEFLTRMCPDTVKLIDKKLLGQLGSMEKQVYDLMTESLGKELGQQTAALAEWKFEMQQMKTPSDFQNNTHQFLTNQYRLVTRGALISLRVVSFVRGVLSSHLVAERTLLKSNAQVIFKLIELVQEVRSTMIFFWPTITEWFLHAAQYWSGCLLRILDTIKSQLVATTGGAGGAAGDVEVPKDEKNVDWVSALVIAEKALTTSLTKTTLATCAVSLEIGSYKKHLTPVDACEVEELIRRLGIIIDIGQTCAKVTDCSFLYLHRSLISVYFSAITDDPLYPIDGVERFLAALQDAGKYAAKAKHCERATVEKAFKAEVLEGFRKNIVEKMCTLVENDLRLAVHARQNQTMDELEARLYPSNKAAKNLQQQSNASAVETNTQTLRAKLWIHLKPFRVVDEVVSVKREVEIYLEKTFYNITAVALHDGETYTKMRRLASQRFGLELATTNLPYMTVDQGLDILVVVKNLDVFVSNYGYDLNEQLFIEKTGKNRSLNVMRVQQVVNSIKTHGSGIVNLAVNYAYQLLKIKFHTFSQFLFDDQIKYQLVKEIKHYRDSIDELNQMYPFRRAERFNASITKLGVTASGQTFLDKFRELITQIGNAIGFIRLIRAGAAESASLALHFVPKLYSHVMSASASATQLPDDPGVDGCLKSMTEALGASPRSTDIAHGIDSMIEHFGESFTPSNDYIEMLITVFAKEFRNYEKFIHLRNFFIIVPALTVNYTEHILACRSKVGRRSQNDDDFTFVDDGFCLGVAYILTLLNQVYFYDSLNWFESVFDKLDSDIVRTQGEQAAAQKRKDESFSHTLAIRLQRLRDVHQEYEFLSHTMHSATMLFKLKDYENEEEETFLEDF